MSTGNKILISDDAAAAAAAGDGQKTDDTHGLNESPS